MKQDDPLGGETIEKIIRWLAFGVGMLGLVVAACFYGCRAHGQEPIPHFPKGDIEPPVMTFPVVTNVVSNEALRTLMKRPAQPVVPSIPPLPSAPRIVMTMTNANGDIYELRERKAPAPLVQDTPKTNTFWASCPECKVRAVRTPQRIEVVGSRTVSGGDELERYIYFRCCRQEFRRKNYKFVEEEIAIEVPVK